VSAWFFIGAYLLEAALIMYALHLVRKIRRDLSLFPEICRFAAIWLIFSNLNLFLLVQNVGLNLVTLSRLRTSILLMRSFFAGVVVSVPPLLTSYRERIYFQLPPSKDCIQTIEMVLNIPIAIDRFFDYLVYNFPEATKCFALFFDLRLYDDCVDSPDADDEQRISFAQEIFERYLDEGSEHQVVLDPNVMDTFEEKYRRLLANQEQDCDGSVLHEHLFLEVYGFVINTLRQYFGFFKGSPDFVKLEDDIQAE
jgi:hypothetical protein